MATEKQAASTASTRTAGGAAETKDGDTQSRGPVTTNLETGTAQGLATKEGREADAKVVDERLERLNDENREGHEKNMRKVEERAQRAADNTEKGPTSGREWNRNTPRVDKDGNKHWY